MTKVIKNRQNKTLCNDENMNKEGKIGGKNMATFWTGFYWLIILKHCQSGLKFKDIC